MKKTRIVVIGGYGFFGRRLTERISLQSGLHVTIAGRCASVAAALAGKLRAAARAELASASVDAMSQDLGRQLTQLQPDVVINASGPFQGQDYRVAEACLQVGSHYIDLADGREFVNGIGALNARAIHAEVLVTSGASSVPALSSAAADRLACGLQTVEKIKVGISPGNRT